VFEVKAAERPHLLGLSCGEDENHCDEHPALLDGCDIPAWRKEELVGPVSMDLLGALRIGAGSSLLRLKSQWPHLNTNQTPWQALREKLLMPPSEDISRVDVQDVAQQASGITNFSLEWEIRNVPVLIENCTQGWKAMPVYEDDNPDANFWNGGGKGGWT